MLQLLKSTILVISALFPLVNPLGGSPIFLGLTRNYPHAARRILARQVSWNSLLLLVGSFLTGTHILAFFGISVPVVQVGGGLIVISTGWAMLNRKDEEEREDAAQRKVGQRDIFSSAFYPLTLPLTVGPGSISTAITLGANMAPRRGFIFPILGALLGLLLIAISIFLCYGFADRLAKLLGPTGMNVIMRLSSFLVVCIGVQILWNGVKALLSTLGGSAP